MLYIFFENSPNWLFIELSTRNAIFCPLDILKFRCQVDFVYAVETAMKQNFWLNNQLVVKAPSNAMVGSYHYLRLQIDNLEK